MRVIILVNILYCSFISNICSPLVEKHWPKGRSSCIAFAIDVLGIPDLCDVKQKKHLFLIYLVPQVFAWFLFYLNTAWRRIAADIKVKVKRARRLQAI